MKMLMKPELLGEEIVNRLNHETAEYAVRDVSFLSCSIFTDTHRVSFPTLFDFSGFTVIFWYQQENGQVIFYRSGKEYARMAELVGKRYLRDISEAERVSEALIDLSDRLRAFIARHAGRAEFLKHRQELFLLYRDFFAYHQAVYWPSEYLASHKDAHPEDSQSVDEVMELLGRAYKYNETIVPEVEQYFQTLDIGHHHFDEVGRASSESDVSIRNKRSVGLLGNSMFILDSDEAGMIHERIQGDYQAYWKNKDEVRGLAVSRGVSSGTVRLIKDLSELASCKEGDILVTTQTRPQYNSTIRSVRAIVTDEGGYLCHASMLAREFGIPCIVGTRNATTILSDGDRVEVDANEGAVRVKEKKKDS